MQFILFMGQIVSRYAKIRIMQIRAKILFYNSQDGKGIVITPQREKYEFYVAQWDDFDSLPQTGMQVACDIESDQIRSLLPASKSGALPLPQATSDEKEDIKNSLPLWEKNRKKIDSIRISVPVKVCVDQYFKQIEEDIQQRTGYRDAKYKLDFLRMRRFLFTMYNNLTELDLHFITPRVKMMRDDLLQMSTVYDDYKSKATYPEIAFEKVFLIRQEEYVTIREEALAAFTKLGGLREAESRLADLIAEKEAVLERTLRLSPMFEALEEEHKALKTDYVDTVHMMATLDEQYHKDLELMMAFEQEFKESFFEHFNKASQRYKSQILTILDAQAYLFDEQLWLQAQKSKIIRRFFEESHIQGDFSSKTYLKYYLNSLDPEKISSEQRELFKLYNYLESINRDTVVVVVSDMDEAFHFKSLFAQISMPVEYQVFIDTKKAFLWMQKHPISLLLLDSRLAGISAENFLFQVREKIGTRAAALIFGSKSTKLPDGFDGVMEKPMRSGPFKEKLQELLKEKHD